jgi:hypothetical protein
VVESLVVAPDDRLPGVLKWKGQGPRGVSRGHDTMSTTSAPTTPKPRRRWLQYSLRTLMVLMLVFGCGLGWLVSKIKLVREQTEAVKAIGELGGRVEYEPASGGMARTAVTWVGKLLREDWSMDVRAVFYFGSTQVTDAGLSHLRGLTQLQELHLGSTRVTDVGLEHVQGLTQLKKLSLNSTPVTDAGLEHLRGLTQLQCLWLDSTQITDAGLSHLRGLTQLNLLSLDGTQVTDAGLSHLQGLTQLQGLFLDSTQVTGAGVNELKKALPNCQFTR